MKPTIAKTILYSFRLAHFFPFIVFTIFSHFHFVYISISRIYILVFKGFSLEDESLCLFNHYSPKAKWLSVNIHRDEVEVNIHL